MYSPLLPTGTMLHHMVDKETVTLVNRTTHNRMRLPISIGQGRSRFCLGTIRGLGTMRFMALWENHRDTRPARNARKVKLSLVLFGEGRDDGMGTVFIADINNQWNIFIGVCIIY